MRTGTAIKAISFLLISLLVSSCAGTKATANEVWTLVELITQGEDIQSNTDIVEVRNCCDVVENKTVSCSAGTSSDLSVGVGGSVGAPNVISVEPSIGVALGFSRNSGESLELPTPPPGQIYQYRVTTTYSVIAGEAMIRSSSGQEKKTAYRFQARCSLKIEPNRESTMCNESCSSQPQISPSILPDTPSPLSQSSQASSPRIYNFSACLEPCNGTNSTRSFPEATKKLYVQWNYENIPYGASYIRKWTMDDREWVRYNCTWTGSESGYDSVTLTEPKGLHSGTWEVTIIVNGVILLREQIIVAGNWNYWDPAGTFDSCYGKSN